MTDGDLAMKILNLTTEVQSLKMELDGVKKVCKDCANELCLQCGGYKNEHLGACYGCRWKKVRHGDVRADS